MTFDNVIGDIHATAPDSDWQTAGMQAIGRSVRQASPQDAAGCVAIYRPYVEATAISWEIEVPTVGEMAARITAARKTHEWLIPERDDQIIGFAYGHAFNRFLAYQWSAETGVYINVDHYRAGGGPKLYTQLLHRLTERGYWRAFAGITQPNEASNGFPIFRVPGCWPIPARRMETRQLARRRMDATRSARNWRPRRTSSPII